jgi:hypothetical protein
MALGFEKLGEEFKSNKDVFRSAGCLRFRV